MSDYRNTPQAIPVTAAIDPWKAAHEAGAKIGTPQAIQGVDGLRHYVVVPEGCRPVSLSEIRLERNPPSAKTSAQLYTAESFSRYVNQYADGRSRIWADERGPLKVSAILDYHEESIRPIGDNINHAATMGAPARGEHVCWLELKRHELWDEIRSKADKAMTQNEFCEWIEEHSRAFVEPNAAAMREIASTLSAASDAKWASQTRLQSGSVIFSYTEEVTGRAGASGEAHIPQQFKMRTRLFVGGQEVTITCHFRFRLQGGKLSLFYKLYGVDEMEREAFVDCVESIKKTTGIDPFYGKCPTLAHSG